MEEEHVETMRDFIPVPTKQKVMPAGVFTRPTYKGSSTFTKSHADLSSNCRLPLIDDSQEDLAAALDEEDELPVIRGLFSHATSTEEQTCSLEYWLSIFGTTGATPVGQAIKFPIEVTNGVFIGNDTCIPTVAALEAHNIKHVINAAPDTFFPLNNRVASRLKYIFNEADICYFQLDGLLDSPTAHILPYLGPSCTFITSAQEAGERVLVCSKKGANRCVCIVMAYLINTGFAASIREAAAAVKEVHPAARVSRKFIFDLDQFCNQVVNETEEGDTPSTATSSSTTNKAMLTES